MRRGMDRCWRTGGRGSLSFDSMALRCWPKRQGPSQNHCADPCAVVARKHGVPARRNLYGSMGRRYVQSRRTVARSRRGVVKVSSSRVTGAMRLARWAASIPAQGCFRRAPPLRKEKAHGRALVPVPEANGTLGTGPGGEAGTGELWTTGPGGEAGGESFISTSRSAVERLEAARRVAMAARMAPVGGVRRRSRGRGRRAAGSLRGRGVD